MTDETATVTRILTDARALIAEPMTDYEALKKSGHSAFKSAEIVLDAERGDAHAIAWIKAVRVHQEVVGEGPCLSYAALAIALNPERPAMFMICHEDSQGAEFTQPITFETKAQAVEYMTARPDIDLHPGHAIILYECRYVDTLREAPAT